MAIQWNGVFNMGTALTVSDSCKEMWTTFVNGKKVEWRSGFHSQRVVVGDKGRYIIDCKVLKNSGDSTGSGDGTAFFVHLSSGAGPCYSK